MAVVAGLFAFSCVTDTTEDLGVNMNAGQHTLSVSMEAARTHLGEKAEGVYPLYWSEGDVIAVNGTASNPLAVDGDAANAVFQFGEAVAYPYNVVYPAVEGELNAVEFPAIQEYAVGNIANGVAPMYGYSVEPTEGEEATPIQMNHLAGILRFAVKGNGEVLKSLTVQAESGVLSGIFTVDCTSGALTAKEGSTSNVVSMTFGEGVTLSSEATLLHVAIPAGKYGALKIVLTTTEGKVMTLLLNTAGARAVEAGVVREFREFAFAENDVEREWFEIYTSADLLNFAKNHAVLPVTKGAKLMATIDMTGIAWTSIEGFSKIFDGGNANATVQGDNGICIKGLTAALFGTVQGGTIQNVKLTNSAITLESTSFHCGVLVNTLAGGTVNNCEVSGYLSVKAPGALSIGGVVGIVNATSTITNVVNRCSVTVDVSTNKEVRVGGIVGRFTTQPSTITDCSNYGAVLVEGSNTAKSRIGGIVGYVEAGGELTGTRLNNYGTVTLNHSTGTDTHFAGIIGSVYAKTVLSDCHNNSTAAVSISGDTPNDTSIGGILGYVSNVAVVIDLCSNAARIEAKDFSGLQIFFGGIVGYLNGTGYDKEITNTSNSGTLYYDAVASNGLRMGGIVGYAKAKTTMDNLINTGDIEVANNIKGDVKVGGIAGSSAVDITNSFVKSNITTTATATGSRYVGGITADSSKKTTNCTAYCAIKAIGYTKNVGMISSKAYSSSAPTVENCKVGGKIALTEVEGEDANGDDAMLPEWYILDNTHEAYDGALGYGKDYWYKYIYAGEIAEDVATAACELLTTEPTTPTISIN